MTIIKRDGDDVHDGDDDGNDEDDVDHHDNDCRCGYLLFRAQVGQPHWTSHSKTTMGCLFFGFH